MPNRLVLVTGASAGLGTEFAHQFAQRGWDVALTARRADRLDALAEEIQDRYRVEAFSLPQDLSKSKAPAELINTIEQKGRHIDAIVNNAGYGLTGTFFNTSWKDQNAFIRVLFTAPCELVHRVLPGMQTRNYGRIINVASLAGYSPGANGHTLYAPIKSAMIKFSEAIDAEAQAQNLDIHCSALCPGFTYTEFHDVNGTRDKANQLPEWMWMEAAPVVEAGIAAVMRGQPVCVPGAVNKGLASLSRIMPEPIARAVLRSQSRRIRSTE